MMLDKVIMTCAVTGNLTTPQQHPGLPVTPREIADSGLEAAEAGAAILHIHVRDPETGRPSMELDLYREVVALVRERNSEVILNLTTGPGGRFVPDADDPKIAAPGTTLLPPEARVTHVAALKPQICTLDLNTMNSGGQVVINTPPNVVKMAQAIRAAGTIPEIELFDSGDLILALDLIRSGELAGPGLYSFVLGVKYGLPPTPEAMIFMRNMLPPGAVWTGFGIGRAEFPMLGQSVLLGGHARVGMEDNIYLSKGVLTPGNAALVQHGRGIVEALGTRLATPVEAREILALN